MDSPFFLDTREPFFVSDLAAVTLAATDKALYPKDNFPSLGGQYFARPGKKLWVRVFGKITTGATPGNLTADVYYGSGADATGVILASSAAVALTANQTNISFTINVFIRCVTIGAAGTLYCTGELDANPAVIGSTLQPVMIPASAAAVSGAVDLTSANIISVQLKRSGSTAETATVQDMHVIAMN